MRICHITINNIEFERRIHNQLESAKKSGYKVFCISLGFPGEKPFDIKNGFLNKKIFTRFYERGPLKFLSFNIKLFFFLFFRNIQIIQCHDLWPLPASALFAFIRNKKLIYDAHEYYCGLNIFRKRPVKKFIWLLFEWMCIPKVEALITVSKPLGEFYKKKYRLLNNVKIIRNLPKYEEIKESKNTDIVKDQNTIIFHGHFKPGRGLENLVKAMKEIPFANLKLVGGGEIKEDLDKIVSNLNLKNVEFTGYINQEDLISNASEADIGVVLFEPTSINYAYALPNKFFEYAMAGIPILASNIETLEYYISKYNCGKTVNPGSSQDIARVLEEMIKDRRKLKTWSKNSKLMSKECNWEKESQKLLDIYNEIKN